MSNVHTARFASVMAAIKMCAKQGIVDLTEDDIDFVTQDKLWVSTERSRVRRCVESLVYGCLDTVGLPRFGAPAEYIAGVIVAMVHPKNYMAACAVMDGCEFTENIINDVDAPLSASHLFSLVVNCKAGADSQETLFAYHQKHITKE